MRRMSPRTIDSFIFYYYSYGMLTASLSESRSTVSGLSDDQLLEQTGKLARLDHEVQVFVIDHLCEIEARRLYLRRGYSSPFDYATRGLGYSAAPRGGGSAP